MANKMVLRYVRCEHCKMRFKTIKQARKHVMDKHGTRSKDLRARKDYTAIYGNRNAKPRDVAKRGTGKNTNLQYVLCQHCKERFGTYEEAINHVHEKHGISKDAIRSERNYKGIYKPNTAAKAVPQVMPGVTELVIPIYIKIPLAIGQPVIIEPLLAKE